jgi:protein ImuB
VIATAASADEVVAVIAANRVTATSPAARAEGVEIGLRRREAQRRCPGLQIVDPDPDRDARVFAAIAALVDLRVDQSHQRAHKSDTDCDLASVREAL